jgi:hypothetical protein
VNFVLLLGPHNERCQEADDCEAACDHEVRVLVAKPLDQHERDSSSGEKPRATMKGTATEARAAYFATIEPAAALALLMMP